MFISTNAIIVNAQNRVLLVQRSDTFTFAPPGGGLEPNELPPEGAAREVFEETGAIVSPGRLAAVFFWPNKPTPFLTFSFRATMENGRLRSSDETRRVGFYPVAPLPRPMMPFHRRRVEAGLAYTGGPPTWALQQMTFVEGIGKQFLTRIVYPLQWKLSTRASLNEWYGGDAYWQIGAFVVIRDEAGRVLWVRRTDADLWNLPGGGAQKQEPPWQTAVRETYEETGLHVRLTDLSGVYMYRDRKHVIFTFTAVVERGQLTTGPEAAAFDYFAPGAEPANVVAQHVQRAADACRPRHATQFCFQPGHTPLSDHATKGAP